MKKNEMKKHILPIISLILLIIVLGVIIFDYFTKGSVPKDWWGTLIIIILSNTFFWDYWKEYFMK